LVDSGLDTADLGLRLFQPFPTLKIHLGLESLEALEIVFKTGNSVTVYPSTINFVEPKCFVLSVHRPAAVMVDCWDRAHALISMVALFSYRRTLVDQRELAQVQRLECHAPV
jgi:hypothetical protein